MEGRLLQSLAKDVGATRHQKKSTILPFDSASLRASIDESSCASARTYLSIRRQASGSFQSPDIRQSRSFSNNNGSEYSQRELDMAIDIAVENQEAISTVAGLIKLGANSDLRVTLLQAVAQRDVRLIKLLASQRDPYGQEAAVDAALSNVLAQVTASETFDDDSEAVISVLLATDGNVPQIYFDKAVSQQQTCLVELLLRARRPIAQQVVSRNLWPAVRAANYKLTAMLLAYGADTNATTALTEATKAKRLKLAVALIVNAQQRLPPQQITTALKTALNNIRPVEDIYWLKLLLYAGADGSIPEMAVRLCQAVSSRDFPTITLLVTYHAPIAIEGPNNALKAAVQAKDCAMMRILLQGSQSNPTMLGDLIPSIVERFPTEGRLEPTRLLLDAGASGRGISDALVNLSKSIAAKYADDPPDALDTAMLETFVTSGATVDWKGGAALAYAFTAGNRQVFTRLSELKPSEATRSSVIASCYEVDRLPLSPTQTELALSLLREGVDKSVLNSTLAAAVRYDSTNAQFIGALVDYGADTSHRDSKIAKNALELCTPAAFAAVVRGLDVTSPAVRELIPASMEDPEKAKLLLARGCRQEDLDAALASEVKRENIRHEAFDLLLAAGASLDSSGEDVIGSVCQAGDLVALQRILRSKPSRDKIGHALRQAISSSQPCRYQIVELLLQSGVDKVVVNECLALAVCEPAYRKTDKHRDTVAFIEKDDRLSIVKLLLAYGADVNYGNGTVLKLAVVDSNLSLISVLAQSNVSEEILWLVFSHAACVIDDHDARYTIFQIILAQTKTQPTALHDALVDLGIQRSQCLHLWALLLDHGASVNHQNGEALVQTIKQQNLAFVPLLLEQSPSPEVVERALSTALNLTPGLRQAVIQKLLDLGVPTTAMDILLEQAVEMQDEPITRLVLSKHHNASGEVLSKALIGAMDHSPNLRWSLMETLFDSCAGYPNTLGDALCHAIEKQDIELIRFAIGHKPSADALNRALVPTMKYSPELRLATTRMLIEAGAEGEGLDEVVNYAVAEHDKNLVRLVLKHRAMLGPKASEGISTAATRGDVPMLTGLLAQADDRSTMSRALDAMTDARTVFEAKSGFACANMLLKKGVEQRSLDKALAAVVEDTVQGLPGGWYVDNLIKYCADVNAFDGECVKLAAQHGDWQLFDQLVAAGATSKTVSLAVCPLLSSGMEEEKLLERLDKCFAEAKPSDRPRNGQIVAEESATYLCLKNYPQSRTLLKCLLDNGCPLDWYQTTILDAEVGEEEVDPLLWCLGAEDVRLKMTDEVLEEMIGSGTNINCSAPKSSITPLMIAAQNDSRELLDSLITRGADVNAEDRAGRTPLFIASQAGCLAIVRQLCAGHAREDDGSVHEAAKTLRPDIVDVLLQAGHHPDYPSDFHEGRSAFLETLLKVQVTSSEDKRNLARILKALKAAKADTSIDYEGKTAVYCALTNNKPVDVMAALLATDEWQRLNDDCNLFTDAFGRKYSPTMYIEQGIWEGDAEYREPLLKLLRQKRCKDRYYATKGDQPPDAVGVPEDLAKEDRARKAIRDQHRLQLKLAHQAHQKQLELQQARHEAILQQERDRDAAQIKTAKNKYGQVTRHEQQLAAQRLAQTQEEYEMTMHLRKESISQQRAFSDDAPPPPVPPKPSNSIGSRRGSDATHEQKLKAQRAFLREQEDAAEKASKRRMAEIERQDESIKLRNKMVMSQIDARTKAQAALAKEFGRHGHHQQQRSVSGPAEIPMPAPEKRRSLLLAGGDRMRSALMGRVGG